MIAGVWCYRAGFLQVDEQFVVQLVPQPVRPINLTSRPHDLGVLQGASHLVLGVYMFAFPDMCGLVLVQLFPVLSRSADVVVHDRHTILVTRYHCSALLYVALPVCKFFLQPSDLLQ